MNGKIIQFYIEADQLEKWLYQNRACYTGAFIEGVLLDNFVVDTPKGYAAIYEKAVNEWTSKYLVEYAISKEKDGGKYKWFKGFSTVWKNWYDFEKQIQKEAI